jgi:hypothetical protein
MGGDEMEERRGHGQIEGDADASGVGLDGGGYGDGPDAPVEGGDAGDDEPWFDGRLSLEAPRRRRRGAAVLGAAAVALLVIGYLAVSGEVHRTSSALTDANASAGSGSSSGGAQDTRDTLDPETVQSTAQAFFTAWQSGDDAAAAALTDAPEQAGSALAAYRADLHLRRLSVRRTGTDGSGEVAFDVAASVRLAAGAADAGSAPAAGTWDYSSQLTVYQVDGKPLIEWRPDVLAPGLTADAHLALLPVQPDAGQATVTDRQGEDLADSPESTLRKMAGLLGQDGGGGAGTPGIDVQIVDAAGDPADGTAPAVVTAPVGGRIETTIDADAEKAALAAVGRNQNSSMVVLQPTTGDVLAIANNDGGLDDALVAQIAPGSTMKVVTSTAMLENGMTMDSDVACPAVLDIGGAVTHNSDGESRPADTPLIDDFAASCNNAFGEQYRLLSGDLLAHTAQRYFGLNEPWDIGLGQPTTYFTIPTGQSDAEVAAEAFGQGRLEGSPLAMASVAATVDTGSFHQPVVVPGARQVAATPLPPGVDAQLKSMMRAVITSSDGTAHDVGFGPGVYAKTGTADDQPGEPPNSWIIVFDPSLDIAIGAVVLDAGAGDQYAGPEALSVIKALG